MIVTISSEYGCGALAIADELARRLGYEVIDRQLPVVVARRLKVPTEAVESSETGGRSFGERLLSGLELATPELAPLSTEENFDEEVVRGTRAAVEEYAARGRVVIVGRASGATLGRRPDVVRVFLYAPREARVARIVERMRVDAKTARSEIERVDRAKDAYLRDWFAGSLGAPEQHDLAIDTASFGVAGSAAIVVAAVAARA